MLPVLPDYLAWLRVERALQPSSIKVYERELRALRMSAGCPLEQVQADDLRRYLVAVGGSAGTIARRIAALRSFYGFLVRTGRRADDPSAQLSRPKVRRGLPRPVRDAKALFRERLDPTAQRVAIFLLETGLRISEACAVDVRPPAPEVLLVLGKGGKERLVPLTDEARAALNELGGRLPWGPRAIQKRFREAGFTPHQLRHTIATELAEAGADIVDIQKLLGHSSPATTTVYAQYSTRRLRAALDRRDQP